MNSFTIFCLVAWTITLLTEPFRVVAADSNSTLAGNGTKTTNKDGNAAETVAIATPLILIGLATALQLAARP